MFFINNFCKRKDKKNNNKVKFVYNIFRALKKTHIYLNAPKKLRIVIVCCRLLLDVFLDDG